MTLSPRAIALQGMGFASLLVAVQGYASASPYRRGPRGTGFAARPFESVRLALQNTTRAPLASAPRAASPATTRPSVAGTTRLRC